MLAGIKLSEPVKRTSVMDIPESLPGPASVSVARRVSMAARRRREPTWWMSPSMLGPLAGPEL